jgi:hypothetical protein
MFSDGLFKVALFRDGLFRDAFEGSIENNQRKFGREAMDDLNCKSVRQALWSFTAHPRQDADRPGIASHLRVCRECELYYGELRSLRAGLQQLPVRPVPPLLTTRLQVLASRERARLIARRDFRTWLVDRMSRIRLSFDNLLKPFAVPAAGGILASVLCFGIIVDTLHYRPDWQEDLPIGFSSEIAIDELSPFSVKGRDVMVQLDVDSSGHVTDYSMLPGNTHPSPEELQEVGNLVLYSTFTPAMRFGRPIASKRMFYIWHIDVKG